MSNLYDRSQAACQARGLSVSTMCLNRGMSKSVLSDLKSGRKKTLSAQTLAKIAQYLQVSTDSLLGKDPVPEDILDQVDVAFYGDFKALDAAQKEAVRDMVRAMRARRKQE